MVCPTSPQVKLTTDLLDEKYTTVKPLCDTLFVNTLNMLQMKIGMCYQSTCGSPTDSNPCLETDIVTMLPPIHILNYLFYGYPPSWGPQH